MPVSAKKDRIEANPKTGQTFDKLLRARSVDQGNTKAAKQTGTSSCKSGLGKVKAETAPKHLKLSKEEYKERLSVKRVLENISKIPESK